MALTLPEIEERIRIIEKDIRDIKEHTIEPLAMNVLQNHAKFDQKIKALEDWAFFNIKRADEVRR